MTTCPRCGAQVEEGVFCANCGAPLAPTRPAQPRRRGRRRAVKIALGAITALMVACVVVIVVASVWDPIALPLSVVAAVVPALVYSWIVLSLDRYEQEPRRAVIATFGWGAVGAVLFSIIAEVAFAGILNTAVGPEASDFLTVAVGAPVIEETFKGIALLALLWFFRREFDNVLDGLVYGALIGLGFAMTENILYFGAAYFEDGVGGLGELFVVRAVIDGFGHAQYTATTGAAVGWARSRYSQGWGRFIVPVGGWALAVFQHFLWNTGAIVIAGLQGEDATIWSIVLIEAPLFTFPALIVLYLIARVAGRRELRILQEQLAGEVEHGVLTPAEYRLVTTGHLRKQALREAKARGGRPLRKVQRRFFQVAAELAFRKYHLSRGEPPKPGQQAPEAVYRAELASVRAQLAAAGLAVPA